MEITCYRGVELQREPRFLPANTYNLIFLLLSRSTTGCVFVPIRRMQYLAVIDAEEIIFLDGNQKCWIDIAWQKFAPQLRANLADPISYQALYYSSHAAALMPRLQSEFLNALIHLKQAGTPSTSAKIIKFHHPHNT